jgi:cytochrome c553
MNLRSPCLARIAALLLAMPAVAFALPPGFLDLRDTGPVHGNADAVRDRLEACSACHGRDGVSPVPIFPSIGGMPVEYLYWQLVEFQREADPESPMTALVMTLGDQDLRDYATWYAAQKPVAPAAVDAVADERIARIFREGDVAAGIPPCSGCHGADAGGHPLATSEPRYRLYPPLRGQHAAYLAQRLKDFRDGKNLVTSNDRIMHGVAEHISDEDAQALADWLQAMAR